MCRTMRSVRLWHTTMVPALGLPLTHQSRRPRTPDADTMPGSRWTSKVASNIPERANSQKTRCKSDTSHSTCRQAVLPTCGSQLRPWQQSALSWNDLQMAILLTGGAGYIGSHTCVELLRSGEDIVVLDNFRNASPEALRRVEKITGRSVT